MNVMLAAKLYAPNNIKIEKIPIPTFKENEVLIRIKAVGICGSDIHLYKNGRIASTIMKEPLILGHEATGEIVEVGKGVSGFQFGDRVIIEPGISCGECPFCRRGEYNLCPAQAFKGIPDTQGCLCEYVVVPRHYVHKLPSDLPFADGTLIEPFCVALQGLSEGNVKPGDTVAILGAGPVGLMALQGALVRGAAAVYVVDLYPQRLELAQKLGAASIINATVEDPIKAIRDLSGGMGTDVVMETSGSAVCAEQAMKIVRRGGTIVFVGVGCGEVKFNVDILTRSRLKLTGTFRYANQYPVAIKLVSTERIDLHSLVTHRFSLDKVQEAFEFLTTHKNEVIKAVITMK
ncbi:NAD(P)-dependent alcohol dehydrogenase [Neomoorella humiferrea]|uniref:NAD(P)-dependent alcohol dehydrogenase n=1 Tax=Neomoorella humiferrea TaxID=676965 RepID=UPI003D8E957E